MRVQVYIVSLMLEQNLYMQEIITEVSVLRTQTQTDFRAKAYSGKLPG